MQVYKSVTPLQIASLLSVRDVGLDAACVETVVQRGVVIFIMHNRVRSRKRLMAAAKLPESNTLTRKKSSLSIPHY